MEHVKHRAIAIIPARGDSKRIPRKNIIALAGKPLIAYSIEGAKESEFLKDNVYVSTEDKEIAEVSEKLGARVTDRPSELAQDESSTLSVLKQVVSAMEGEGVDFDTVVLLQPTSPLRKTSTIDEGIKKLWEHWEKLDVLFSVKKAKFPPNWLLKINEEILEFLLPNDFSKIRGQDMDKTYEIDGVISIFKKEFIKSVNQYPFAEGKTGFVITDKIEGIDIDDIDDLEIAKAILKEKS